MSDDFIPLLSEKPLCDCSPEEYHQYVKSLYFKEPPKKTPSRAKPFIAKLTKNGRLSLQIRRNPPWLSEEEMRAIEEKTGKPLNEIFIALKEKGGVISTQGEQDEIRRKTEEIPW